MSLWPVKVESDNSTTSKLIVNAWVRGIAESVRLDIERVYAQNVLRAVATIRSKRRKEGSVMLFGMRSKSLTQRVDLHRHLHSWWQKNRKLDCTW